MDTNNGFSKNILNIIKEKNIKPKPKWHFLLKNYVIWSIGIIALIVGGLAFSVIIYLLRYNDWGIYSQITGGIGEFILLTLPYFWLLLLAVFIFVVYYNIKHTKKGYRYSLPMIVIISIVLSMTLGILFSQAGLGRTIDDCLGEKAPFYAKIFNRGSNLWNQPKEGRLAGLVMSIKSDAEFIILDQNQNEWRVFSGPSTIMPSDIIKVGSPVKLIGERLGDNEFSVKKIIPVGPGRKFFMRHKNRHFQNPISDPMTRDHVGENQKFQKRFDEFPRILEKYPELKKAFEQNLLERKESIKKIMESDPEFIKHLERLNIAPEILEQLRAE